MFLKAMQRCSGPFSEESMSAAISQQWNVLIVQSISVDQQLAVHSAWYFTGSRKALIFLATRHHFGTMSMPIQIPEKIEAISPDDDSMIDLRNPAVAAILSWLVPGLGQMYQGRRSKGILFMSAILGTFLVGLGCGGGKVVYASWKPGEARWAYVCQLGAGVISLPAAIQSMSLSGATKTPLFGTWMAPPLQSGQYVSRSYAEKLIRGPDIDADDFFDRPPLRQFRGDQLSMWHRRLGRWFEIGTLYTMLAGMLNILVIFDAWSGPLDDRQSLAAEAKKEAHKQSRTGEKP